MKFSQIFLGLLASPLLVYGLAVETTHAKPPPASQARVKVDGVNVFYRFAGQENKPVILLLHGFPSSSHQFRNLIPLLATSYRVIAPDLPGYGFTEVPAEYKYTFANLADTTDGFLKALKINKFAVYIFDYGAPTGLRLALKRPKDITAVISQSGNAYDEGLGPFWNDIRAYWKTGNNAEREVVRTSLLSMNTTMAQYTIGATKPDLIQPEAYWLDQALMDRPGNKDIQLDLFYDYRTNLELYPQFQAWMRNSGVPVLVAWGKDDPIFISPGAEAFKRDVKKLEFHLIDAGHFAIETNEEFYSGLIKKFLERRWPKSA